MLGTYGGWTADQLSQATHAERPWIEARQGVEPGARSNEVIDTDVMQDYFTGLYNEI